MKQRKMLSFTLYQLGLFFRQELPGLVAQADASRDAGEFRARLEEFVARHAAAQGEAAEHRGDYPLRREKDAYTYIPQ